MDNKIIELLEANIHKTNLNKSSHWRRHLPENSDYKNIYKSFGFGELIKKNYKSIFHNFFAKIVFGKEVFLTETFKKYKKVYDAINWQINDGTLRHIFTYEKLKNIVNPKRICIIGDGKINGVLGSYLTFPKSTIFNVNLSEVLIHDYLILKKLNIDLKHSIKLVCNKDETLMENQLYLIPSNLKKILLNKDIDLFININSFQEMNTDEIDNYFKIIKNNKSKLYCCNREYKKLFGGEEIYFDKYPWDNCKKIFWEDCPWCQRYYSSRPPYIHKFSNFTHCLIDYSHF